MPITWKPVEYCHCSGSCLCKDCLCPCIGAYENARKVDAPNALLHGALTCLCINNWPCVVGMGLKILLTEHIGNHTNADLAVAELYKNPLDFGLVFSDFCHAWCCTPCFLNSLSRSVDEYVNSGQCEKDKKMREATSGLKVAPQQQVMVLKPMEDPVTH
ncbi:unnamed protein product [Amoebophrya sp. A120]|nr:unnamed protein product [Amoebophrya sp. A120]|eukprot:GSA120T00005139001.1